MLLKDLVEHAASNPFVSLVSAIDLRIIQLNQLKKHPLPTFVHSLNSQLNDFLSLVNSVKGWEIPDASLRRDVHDAVPGLIQATKDAQASIRDGNFKVATEIMDKARAELVKKSKITDFDSSPTEGHKK